jgi:lysozyme
MLLIVPLKGPKMTGSLDIPAATLHGIDVSHHQKNIDWKTVARRHDVQFAFVKATEGGDFKDSLFAENWGMLQELGIRRGAYHFFRPNGSGYQQAQHFLQTVTLSPGDLAPVLDLETTDNVPKAVMLEQARVWLQTIERNLNVQPIIYTNQDFYERHLAGVFDNYPLWIARYSDKMPELGRDKKWQFWQYSDKGAVDGIKNCVDINIFWGTPSMLDRYCWFPAEGLPQPLEAGVAP